ncbi:MAG: magnesium-translocating P-type ATPase [Actinobacteria bacterium]|nr:magnesium-translocating P-type ATPase [Actinomycetota bacterium]
MTATQPTTDTLTTFWAHPAEEVQQQLGSTPQGLTAAEAANRLTKYGPNQLHPPKTAGAFTLFLSQFKSPIILILIVAALVSFFLGERTDTLIILIIVGASGMLGFFQEKGAAEAVEKLISVIEIKADVLREGKQLEVPITSVVPGDITLLNAGDAVPGDCIVLESSSLFVDEAALTGETFPVEKIAGVTAADAALSGRTNAIFSGTHVVSGTARALVAKTGPATEFGKVADRLKLRRPKTEFERGVTRFGYLLMEVTLMLVIFIFAVNVYLKRPVLEAFLFSVALAVGLTPQLLPAIISVNLSHGARRMAQQKVIVKRLASIENFGSMNVFCSDKTGTLTEGKVELQGTLDVDGAGSQKVLLYAYINASFESGFNNPIDEAIRQHGNPDISGYEKLYEIPYDFIRKRLSILVSHNGENLLITKGALKNVLAVCTQVEAQDGSTRKLLSAGVKPEKESANAAVSAEIEQEFEKLSAQGLRVLGVACRVMDGETSITKESEQDMTFLGFITFLDPAKADISKTIERLNSQGVKLKIITGDNSLVAANISRQVGLNSDRVLSGSDLVHMSDSALVHQVDRVDIFAEIDPNQKERIIRSLQKAGNVVGYMGDGINDSPALHAADVSISVDSAVDVAKEAADIVLLEKDLSVLDRGVQEGRSTFANTLKYVFMATSANFGNMFSMAGASLFLPFLPLLATQVLLINFLTDLPELTIATDRVDEELVERPRRWNIPFIREFMVTFGLVSSIFDYMTFGALLLIMNATTEQFRTGWFIESVVSASMIVLVIRTRRPFFKSAPSRYLLLTTILVICGVIILPYTPLGSPFQFVSLPPQFLLMLAVILVLYVLTAEAAKKVFYRVVNF